MRSRLSNHSKNINILRFGSTSKNENIAFVVCPSVCLHVHLGVVFQFCKTLPFKRIWHTWERPYFPFHLVVGPCFAPPPHHKVDFWRSSCPRARSLSDAECQVWHYFPTRTTTDINRREKTTNWQAQYQVCSFFLSIHIDTVEELCNKWRCICSVRIHKIPRRSWYINSTIQTRNWGYFTTLATITTLVMRNCGLKNSDIAQIPHTDI